MKCADDCRRRRDAHVGSPQANDKPGAVTVADLCSSANDFQRANKAQRSADEPAVVHSSSAVERALEAADQRTLELANIGSPIFT